MSSSVVNRVDKEYFIYNLSPIQDWEAREDGVNLYSSNDIKSIVNHWAQHDRHFKRIPLSERPDLTADEEVKGYTRFFRDDLKPTKVNGHPQATVSKALMGKLDFDPWANTKRGQVKVLRHLVVWRYLNGGALLPDDLQISHVDADHTVLNLVAESRTLNESRKYCHLYRWNCPHSYYECTYQR